MFGSGEFAARKASFTPKILGRSKFNTPKCEPGPFCCKVSCERVPESGRISRSYVYGQNDLDSATVVEEFLAWADGISFEPEELETGHVIEVLTYNIHCGNGRRNASICRPKRKSHNQMKLKEAADTAQKKDCVSRTLYGGKSSNMAKMSKIITALHQPRSQSAREVQNCYTVFDSKSEYGEIPRTVSVRRDQLGLLCSVLLQCALHQTLFEVNMLGGSGGDQPSGDGDNENMTKRDFVKAFRVLYEYIEKRRGSNNTVRDKSSAA